jgi:hypothetical protein
VEGRDQVVILVLGAHPPHVGAAEGIDPSPIDDDRRNLLEEFRLHLRCNSALAEATEAER